MELRVYVTWLLLAGIVVYEVGVSFSRYHVDKRLWKLIMHSVLLLIFCVMNLQLGFLCLNMQFIHTPRVIPHMRKAAISKHQVPPVHKRAVPSDTKKTGKK